MADQIYRINVNQLLDSQVVINTWHVRSDAPPTSSELAAWVTAFVTPHKAKASNALTFQNLDVRRVDVAGGSSSIYTPSGWPVAGTINTDCIPGVMSALLKGVSLDGVKPAHIRKFLAGVIETDTTAGKLNSTGLTNYGTIVSSWQAYIDAGTDPNVAAVHYTTGANPVVDQWNLIATISLSSILAVQRRRKIGVGR